MKPKPPHGPICVVLVAPSPVLMVVLVCATAGAPTTRPMPKVSALASKAFGSMSEGILYTSLQYPNRYYGVADLRCDDSKMRNVMAIWMRAVA